MCYTRNVVYSDGNANVCEPRALTQGNNPAFGIMFQDNVKVTFLFPLQKQKMVYINKTKNVCASILIYKLLSHIYQKIFYLRPLPSSQK